VEKLAILIMLNAELNSSVVYLLKLRRKEREGKTELSKKLAKLLSAFQSIKDLESFVKDVEDRFTLIKIFPHNDGRCLQHEDFELAIAILEHLDKAGISMLSMHDPSIIEKQYAEDLKRVMHKVYSKKYLGFSITVHS